MRLGQLLAFVPRPRFRTGRNSPWGRLDQLRKAFDQTVCTLIDRAAADPRLGERTDILALLLRSWHDDETGIPAATSAMNCPYSSVPVTKPPHRHWPGRLSGCDATQTYWPNWSERSMRGAARCVGPQFWSRCGCAPSSMCSAAESAHRTSTSAGGGFRVVARCSCALPIFTRIRKSSLTPNDSIRIASAAPGRRHQHGCVRWRSTAVHRR